MIVLFISCLLNIYKYKYYIFKLYYFPLVKNVFFSSLKKLLNKKMRERMRNFN